MADLTSIVWGGVPAPVTFGFQAPSGNCVLYGYGQDYCLIGCDHTGIDIDLAFTPATNLLPIRRLNLPEAARFEIDFRLAQKEPQFVQGSRQSGGRLNHSCQMHSPHCEPHQFLPHGQQPEQWQPLWTARTIAARHANKYRDRMFVPPQGNSARPFRGASASSARLTGGP